MKNGTISSLWNSWPGPFHFNSPNCQKANGVDFDAMEKNEVKQDVDEEWKDFIKGKTGQVPFILIHQIAIRQRVLMICTLNCRN